MRHIHKITKEARPERAEDTTIKGCIEYLLNGGQLFGETSFVDCLKCVKGGGSCA